MHASSALRCTKWNFCGPRGPLAHICVLICVRRTTDRLSEKTILRYITHARHVCAINAALLSRLKTHLFRRSFPWLSRLLLCNLCARSESVIVAHITCYSLTYLLTSVSRITCVDEASQQDKHDDEGMMMMMMMMIMMMSDDVCCVRVCVCSGGTKPIWFR